MKSFNVLSAEQNILRNTILEASAGTGKTFSIENLVVRLILEKDISIEKILIVTFTRPATRDLRIRVRKNICNAIEMLKGNIEPFEYIKIHQDNAESMIRRLQRALLLFDNAAIETIHGFCFRSLRENIFEGDMPLTTQYEGGQPGKMAYLKLIRDYFRTGICEESFCAAQIERVTGKSVNNLEKSLMKEIQKPFKIASTRAFKELLIDFQDTYRNLKFNPEELIAYHDAHKSNYYSNKEIDGWIERFAECTGSKEDFEFLIKQGFLLTEYYGRSNLKTRSKPHPELGLLESVGYLDSIVKEARSKEAILAKMAHEVKAMADRYFREEEMWRFDDLLAAMRKSIQNPLFNAALRQKYQAVIVDEFQDTDPIQWEIFSSLYVSNEWEGNIYIVGDPKQAIYAFRSADIYTYLDAVTRIGHEARSSLDTNYRSHPALIDELNRFFSPEGLFPLPHTSTTLDFNAAGANDKQKLSLIEDGKPPLLCFVAEDMEKTYSFTRVKNEQLFPYIAQEIAQLKQHVPLSEIAILVRKGTEGQELAKFLRQSNIETQLQQSASLSDSSAVRGLRDILAATSDPRNVFKARVALGTSLLGWTDGQLLNLVPEEALKLFHELHQLPILAFFQRILEESAPNLLSSDEGYEVYRDLVHLMELVIEEQAQTPMNLDGLSSFLEELTLLEFEDDESLKRPTDSQEQAVQIMTLHASKGLEFDVVFALGLATAVQEPDKLVPNRETQELEAIIDGDDPRYHLYCKEVDAEKMRLLYVALTRAKKRVYIPYIKGDKAISKRPGTASCMELYARVNPGFLEQFPHEEISIQPFDKTPEKKFYNLIAPPTLTIPWRERYINSFTSLIKSKAQSHEIIDAPRDLCCEEKTIHTFPAGAEVGTFLHSLLESIPLHEPEIEKWLENYLSYSPYKSWYDTLLKLIKNVQTLPFLQGLTTNEMYKEVEFLYPTGQGLLKGIIDLVFRRDGRYYILDWKSNWLGPDEKSYNSESLWNAMKQHDYEMQASLYTEALRRYLGIIEDRTFDECFGGVYYVFLRGIGAGNGVLHFSPSLSPAIAKQA
jgi:exodeoxyribonuclease V beta subunit